MIKNRTESNYNEDKKLGNNLNEIKIKDNINELAYNLEVTENNNKKITSKNSHDLESLENERLEKKN